MNNVTFQDRTCTIREERYSNGRIGLQLFDGEEYVATATVNVPDEFLTDHEMIVKDWSENEGMLQALTDAGIVEPTGETVRVGFAEGMICRLVGRE